MEEEGSENPQHQLNNLNAEDQALERQCQNSQVSVSIPTFEQLQGPSQNENVEDFVETAREKLQEDNFWLDHFEVLNQIRGYNKDRPQQFCDIISQHLSQEIINSCDNLRSAVQRVSITLIKEVFKVNEVTSIQNDILQKMVQKVYEKANFDKNFIKKEAQGAILQLEQNNASLCPAVIQILSQLCFDKNAILCETTSASLLQILKKHQKTLLKGLEESQLSILIKTFARLLDGKRAKLKIAAKEACRIISDNLGKQIFQNYLVDEKDKPLMKNVDLCLQGEKKVVKRNFRDFKKQMVQNQNENETRSDDVQLKLMPGEEQDEVQTPPAINGVIFKSQSMTPTYYKSNTLDQQQQQCINNSNFSLNNNNNFDGNNQQQQQQMFKNNNNTLIHQNSDNFNNYQQQQSQPQSHAPSHQNSSQKCYNNNNNNINDNTGNNLQQQQLNEQFNFMKKNQIQDENQNVGINGSQQQQQQYYQQNQQQQQQFSSNILKNTTEQVVNEQNISGTVTPQKLVFQQQYNNNNGNIENSLIKSAISQEGVSSQQNMNEIDII